MGYKYSEDDLDAAEYLDMFIDGATEFDDDIQFDCKSDGSDGSREYIR
jgi:hypothetical protein